MNREEYIREAFLTLELLLTDNQIEKLCKYHELLMEWNKKINLTAITEFEEIVWKHFVDSVLLLKCDGYPFHFQNKVLDIGTGAGFPGIILAIVREEDSFILIDSLYKRIDFLQIVIRELDLHNVRIFHGRAEDFGKKPEFRNQFDFVVSRALAELPLLIEYCVPFVKQNGYFISYKGPKYRDEILLSKHAMDELSCQLDEIKQFQIREDKRYLLWIKNNSITNSKYPRRAGIPKKKPLI